MKMKWRAAATCLMLPLLFACVSVKAQKVHGWEGTITIPTYKLGQADPNPSFPLINKEPVYPYTMLDNLSNDRVPQTYRAIYLENDFLKITVLPELGGHVYSIYDKVNKREVLYRDSVIKYGLVGPRGAWISGGMEFSFPYAHTTDTVSPVESTLRQNADGSATAIVGAVDWVSNMHWEIELTLRPNTARLEEGVTLFNSTPLNQLYLFWTNTAVSATDDTRYIYPMRETIDDDPFSKVQSWPVWHGVDQSWYKNDPTALAIFGRDVHRNFFGVYYQQANYGVVHVSDYNQDPGKKLWTWGTARSGKIWDTILSDTDGSYNEIQSGRFYTQGNREFMNPRRVEHWTEYWYPVRSLDGGYVEATSQMAINATYGKGPQGQPQVKLMISPVADVADATVIVKQGTKVLKTFAHVHLIPLTPAVYTMQVENLQNPTNDLNVQILSSQNQTLLQWSAADPVDGNPNLNPSAGKTLETKLVPTPQTPVEELYLHGIFIQKVGNLQGAIKIYDQVLERDPAYVPALLKEAWYYYENADFKKAESFIQRAQVRGKEDPSITYAAGVIYRAQGRLSLAKDAFWTSIHYGSALPAGSALAPSFVELGEIAIRQREYAEAVNLLKRAMGYNPGDAFALTDLAVAERLSGNTADASRLAAEAVHQMPLLPYALAEQAQTSHDTDWTKIIRSDRENYLAIASWYYDLGAWQSSDAVLHTAIDKLQPQEISPMMYYYLAVNAREEGNSQQAEEYGKKAASMSRADVFPNRVTDATILAEAIRQNPTDAQARYALGNFLFAHTRYDEAADLWTKALAGGFNDPVLLRNLGVYQRHIKNNPAATANFYQQALQLRPADYRLYADLDEIYEQQGDTAARIKLFQSAPADVLDQDTVRARHALLLIEESKPDQALPLLVDHRFKPWEGGVVIRNMYVLAMMEKGKKALTDHQPAQAAVDFRKAMEYPENMGTGQPYQPDAAEQLYWLGNALAAQKKSAEATAAWTEAAEQGKNNHNASAVFSALAYRKLGNDNQAKEILDRCIQSATMPEAGANDYYAAGMAELYSGNTASAQQNFQRSLELDPLLWPARIALARVNQPDEKAA